VRARRAIALLAALVIVPSAFAQDLAPRREVQPSRAPAALQDEIHPRVLAAAAARLADPACRRIAVAETAFNGWSEANSGWEETWVVDLCGRIVDVLLLFAPGAQGLAVEIPARSVHLRP
jgi:hypothetical protein